VKRIALVEQNIFQVGTVEEILTEANLTSLYRMPVRVSRLNGNTVILAGSSHGNH